MKKVIIVFIFLCCSIKVFALASLDLGFQTRAMGMGGAFTGLSDDSSAIYYNPSLLFNVEQQQITLSYAQLFSMANLYQASYTLPGLRYPDFITGSRTPGLGLALGLSMLSDSGITAYSPSGDGSSGDYITGNQYSFNEDVVMLGLGARLGNWYMSQWALGATFKYYYAKLIDMQSNGFGMDLVLNNKNKYFDIAVMMKNIFLTLKEQASGINDGQEAAPLTLRIGTLIKIQNIIKEIFTTEEARPSADNSGAFHDQFKFTINPVYDMEFVFNNPTTYNEFLGLEAWMNSFLALRVGYNTLNGATFGGSARLSTFQFDYALSVHSELDLTQRVSLSYYFPVASEPPAVTESPGIKLPEKTVSIEAVPGCLSQSNKRTIVFNINTDSSHPIKTWKVRIGNDGLKELYRDYSGFNNPPESIEWNGKDNNNKNLLPGKYFFEMIITYQDNSTLITPQQTIIIDNTVPVVSIKADKEIFSPDGSGDADTLTFFLKAKGILGIKLWKLVIKDMNKNVMKEFSGPGEPPDSLVWDGKQNDGNIIPQASKYQYSLSAEDICGNIFKPTNYYNVRTDIYLTKETNGDYDINLQGVEFDTAKATLRTNSFPIIDRVAQILNKKVVKDRKIQVQGHTDSIGVFKENMDLSKNRAKAVMDYLVNKGISATRISYQGYGSTKPIADNKTEAGRQKNRRVELLMTK